MGRTYTLCTLKEYTFVEAAAMIDLHNHILPGVDDGAADIEESIEIARQFVSEGVVRIAATPHLNPERGTGLQAPNVRQKVAELNDALTARGIDLTVVPGNELYLTPDAPELLEQGAVSPLGDGKTVLVELALWAERPPLHLEDTIFRLQLAGYRPVLAHPERYPFVQRDTADIDGWISRGMILQLTAPALLGEYGRGIRRTAERLLHSGAYALAGSDRHHPGSNRSLAALHQRIAELIDADTADLLLRINPERVLSDQPVVQPDVAPEVRSGFIDRLLGR